MISKSKNQTQKLAAVLAKKILRIKNKSGASILALYGELGSGKTTFVQGFMRGLGVKRHITSPTFIIYRKYHLSFLKLGGAPDVNLTVYHFDLYRINKKSEILKLGFKKIINPPAGGPQNIVLIEWPEKIKSFLPKNAIEVYFSHKKKINQRGIIIN